MIDGALPYLRCPNCERALRRDDRVLRCARGHSFDLARQGYADLTAGRLPHVGDTAAMIADRDTFLTRGHYDFIAEALATFVPGGLVVDAGVGTGRYLARVLDRAPAATGLGLDVSKPALRRAARAHPRAAAVLADVWRPLPIVDEAADAVLNVFAPRNGAEFRRILRPGGRLLVVTPAAGHLAELVDAYRLIGVDPEKDERVREALGEYFELEDVETRRRELDLTAEEVRTLIGMTPSARHREDGDTAAITTGAEVEIRLYNPV
ncbi:putative RNA methyltransferase [Actinoplanes sp. CA-030573]|uniref:putative RNA methyltransferase n=1 Tax=Actinoplanes sp. CA-030573 TaxID=3239898 RepID=UPI003D91EA26